MVDKKDAEGILGIYAPYVRDTIISFEYDVPTLDAFSKRVENISEEYPWVVCLLGDRIIGMPMQVFIVQEGLTNGV
nr:hypothetical protein [Candidatus Brachybacter algidus]